MIKLILINGLMTTTKREEVILSSIQEVESRMKKAEYDVAWFRDDALPRSTNGKLTAIAGFPALNPMYGDGGADFTKLTPHSYKAWKSAL